MAHFSCFPGASALSDFRQTRLLETLARIDANIVGVRGQFLHFVNASEPLTDDDNGRIEALMLSLVGGAVGENELRYAHQ